ncbi:MAG: DNA repair protein RecN [Ruminococcaceae bacterium]|nr:DNA repair protein RecN [Oscillospiraceae bacterium]
MLYSLHIENIAVAKSIDIEFENGFNVLTGETGAGKSIIIDSIGLILGAKGSRELIRQGSEKAVVSALFSNPCESVYALCDEYGIDYDREDLFSVSRMISVDGKSVAKINSRTVSLAQLKSIGVYLINIHGQNENHIFMNKANHILLLDEFAACDKVLDSYLALYSKLTSLKNEITSLREMSKQKDMMIDILNYQVTEITSAKLKDEEEEEKLSELRTKLKEAEKIIKQSSNVYKVICKNDSGISVTYLIDKAIESLIKLADVEPEASEMAEKLTSYKYEITDIADRARELSSFGGIDDPEQELQNVEARLMLIQKLKKKYGSSITEIIKFKQDAEEKLKAFERGEEKIEELSVEYKKIYQNALETAEKLHEIRCDGAKRLGNTIKEALEFLDMPKVMFEIKVAKNSSNGKTTLSSLGIDDVEFMIATNPGEELAPMNKIASGGELSRIMLAMKSAMSDKNGAQTVIFDEIDTGVSGSTSQKIGIKLRAIASNTQTICVTHSPQIAALADSHFFIKKVEIDNRAQAQIELLSDEKRIAEIARIIGGINVTDKQFAAARELINQSKGLSK